uniref:Uncharacterized protein n=1 Tax=Rhizophagus irregularis (strain DAOM 181602 / DAOM 197198 / MUCL 43194) TaxID=747089 RepID=U9UJR0_RHIID
MNRSKYVKKLTDIAKDYFKDDNITSHPFHLFTSSVQVNSFLRLYHQGRCDIDIEASLVIDI